MGILSGILGFIFKGIILLLRSGVYIMAFAAVFIIILIPLKFVVGKLANVLGVNGGGGSGPISNALGGFLNTINSGINGVFSGVGTVFKGTTNTAGMVRDKVLGNRSSGRGYDRHGFNNRNNGYGYNDDYYNGYGNNRYRNNRNHNNNNYNRRNMPYNDDYIMEDKEAPTIMDKNGRIVYGNPKDKNDKYYNVKRIYDENGLDQFGFDKRGRYKDEIEAYNRERNKKGKMDKVIGEKTIANNEVVDDWVRKMKFGYPTTWLYGAAGLSYAAAYSIGKAMDLNVPEHWKNIRNKDTGIQTTTLEQEDIDNVGDIETAKDGGMNVEDGDTVENNLKTVVGTVDNDGRHIDINELHANQNNRTNYNEILDSEEQNNSTVNNIDLEDDEIDGINDLNEVINKRNENLDPVKVNQLKKNKMKKSMEWEQKDNNPVEDNHNNQKPSFNNIKEEDILIKDDILDEFEDDVIDLKELDELSKMKDKTK